MAWSQSSNKSQEEESELEEGEEKVITTWAGLEPRTYPSCNQSGQETNEWNDQGDDKVNMTWPGLKPKTLKGLTKCSWIYKSKNWYLQVVLVKFQAGHYVRVSGKDC